MITMCPSLTSVVARQRHLPSCPPRIALSHDVTASLLDSLVKLVILSTPRQPRVDEEEGAVMLEGSIEELKESGLLLPTVRTLSEGESELSMSPVGIEGEKEEGEATFRGAEMLGYSEWSEEMRLRNEKKGKNDKKNRTHPQWRIHRTPSCEGRCGALLMLIAGAGEQRAGGHTKAERPSPSLSRSTSSSLVALTATILIDGFVLPSRFGASLTPEPARLVVGITVQSLGRQGGRRVTSGALSFITDTHLLMLRATEARKTSNQTVVSLVALLTTKMANCAYSVHLQRERGIQPRHRRPQTLVELVVWQVGQAFLLSEWRWFLSSLPPSSNECQVAGARGEVLRCCRRGKRNCYVEDSKRKYARLAHNVPGSESESDSAYYHLTEADFVAPANRPLISLMPPETGPAYELTASDVSALEYLQHPAIVYLLPFLRFPNRTPKTDPEYLGSLILAAHPALCPPLPGNFRLPGVIEFYSNHPLQTTPLLNKRDHNKLFEIQDEPLLALLASIKQFSPQNSILTENDQKRLIEAITQAAPVVFRIQIYIGIESPFAKQLFGSMKSLMNLIPQDQHPEMWGRFFPPTFSGSTDLLLSGNFQLPSARFKPDTSPFPLWDSETCRDPMADAWAFHVRAAKAELLESKLKVEVPEPKPAEPSESSSSTASPPKEMYILIPPLSEVYQRQKSKSVAVRIYLLSFVWKLISTSKTSHEDFFPATILRDVVDRSPSDTDTGEGSETPNLYKIHAIFQSVA
ncbi:hypothetical protein R3P38DRAFT_2791310 [Favolaschia claudopus]|uniref:Uncharacterized protein n=1 Tax=Favolaschia claudopus TaxID=2862362 RepID=A0AAW0AGB9_9AGAR